MKMMIGRILRSGRRQLHTITSREIIKPLSPTPSHLQTYNLSQLDQRIDHAYMPLLLFYPNNENNNLTPDDKARKMKKALSQSLTLYYPFAGRLHTPMTTYIDCNDEGVVFVEAKHNIQLDKFQHMSEEDESVIKLFADGMFDRNSPPTTSLFGVQLNHFACGGLVVALSMSHRIGDASTLTSCVSHWASVARYGSLDHKEVLPFNPHYIQSPATPCPLGPDYSTLTPKRPNVVTKKFVFPNSRLSDLKNKVLAECGPTLSINKPTRFEVLTSLLYKTAVTTRSSSFNSSFLVSPMDIRGKIVPKLPQSTVGNIMGCLMVTTRHASETSLSLVLSQIQKSKKELEQIQTLQHASQSFESVFSRLGNKDLEGVTIRSFVCSSLCRFPYNKVNFGWGKPTVARVPFGSSNLAGFVLMDTINEDGIEAQVALEADDMELFQNDKEMLTFCRI